MSIHNLLIACMSEEGSEHLYIISTVNASNIIVISKTLINCRGLQCTRGTRGMCS